MCPADNKDSEARCALTDCTCRLPYSYFVGAAASVPDAMFGQKSVRHCWRFWCLIGRYAKDLQSALATHWADFVWVGELPVHAREPSNRGCASQVLLVVIAAIGYRPAERKFESSQSLR